MKNLDQNPKIKNAQHTSYLSKMAHRKCRDNQGELPRKNALLFLYLVLLFWLTFVVI